VQVAYPGMRRCITFVENNDRVYRAFESLSFSFHAAREGIEIVRPYHDSKRLFDPAQPALQFAGRIFCADEMETTYAANREDPADVEELCRFFNRVGAHDLSPKVIEQFNLRAA
jgi:hypothetical protein